MSSPPRDAATIILVRQAAEGPPETLLLQRHKSSAFMGGAYVFPGGKLDPSDRDAAVLDRLPPALRDQPRGQLGVRVAAIRELFEEAGVLLAERDGAPVQVDDELHARRPEIDAGELSFSAFLSRHDLRLRADALHYWARWVTPSDEGRRYDARFFVSVMPAEQEARIDDKEAVAFRWLTASRALAQHGAGDIFLPPPTFRTLEELSELPDLEAIIDAAASRPVAPVLPKRVRTAESVTIVLPWDDEYEALPGEGQPAPEAQARLGRWGSRMVIPLPRRG